MLKNFRAYQLAIKFYKSCEKVRCERHLEDQLKRAAASISLNLAEGSERGSKTDQRRFYRMAMGSARECQAILDLLTASRETLEAVQLADDVAATVFCLCKSLDKALNPTAPENRELGTEN